MMKITDQWLFDNLMLEKSPHGCSSGTSSNVCANLGWVEVVVDEAIDDGGEIVLDQGLADGLQTGIDKSKGSAKPLDKLDDFLFSWVTGDPFVQILDNIHANVTQEILGLDIHGGLAHTNEAHDSEDGLVHVDDVDVTDSNNCQNSSLKEARRIEK